MKNIIIIILVAFISCTTKSEKEEKTYSSNSENQIEMKSSDYEHLILTFDKHFGWHVTLEFDVHPSSKVRK